MDFLLKNIELLTIKYPFAHWSSYFSLSQEQYEIRASRAGEATLLVNGSAVHSLYSPLTEARKQASSLNSNLDAIILLGFGLGYLIEEIATLYPNASIYLAESNPSLWRAFFESADRSLLINSPSITMLFGFESDQALIELWQQRRHYQIHSITNRLMHQYNPLFYDHLYNLTQNYSMRKNVNSRTLERYGHLWVANLAKNLPFIAALPGVVHLFQQFRSTPALLIAAGPSLNNYLPWLPMLRERMLLVCVDTALPALLHAKVKPDIIVSVDSQYWNSRHFDHCYSKGSILVADPSIYPTILRRDYGFNCYLSSSLFPWAQLVEEAMEHKGQLESGGSVATTAFSLCKAMGCSSIWAIGLDLSYPQGASHVRGSRFESWALADHHRLSPLLNRIIAMTHSTKMASYAANRGGLILTDQRMTLYRLWFEEHGSDIPSYNLSDGIFIKNIKPAFINDALALKPCRQGINHSISRLATEHRQYESQRDKMESFKQNLTHQLIRLQELAKEALVLANGINVNDQGKNITTQLEQLELIDQKIIATKEIKMIEFFIEPLLKNHIKQQQHRGNKTEHLASSIVLYQEIINHLTTCLELFS